MSEHRLAERIPEAAFALALAVTPVLGVLVPHGVAVVLPILGLVAAWDLWRGDGFDAVPRPALIFLSAFGLWAGISLFWAPDPVHAAQALLRPLALSLAGLLSLAMVRQRGLGASRLAATGLALGAVAACLLLAVEYRFDHELSVRLAEVQGNTPLPRNFKSALTRGDAILAVLFWPLALLALHQKRRSLYAAVALILVIELISDSRSSALGLVAGVAVMVSVRLFPRRGLAVLAGLMALVVLAMPWAVSRLPPPPESFKVMSRLPLSGHHRLAIWSYAAERIGEHPLRGWGMDASRADPGGAEELNIQELGESGQVLRTVTGARLPLHPHNSILQWHLELGVPGALLLAAGLAALMMGAGPLAGLLACGIVISSLSYGAWQSWWLASLWIAGIAGLAARQAREAT